MRLELKLRAVLQQAKLDDWGIVQKIARETGLGRNAVQRIYDNAATAPSLDLLAKLSTWLESKPQTRSLGPFPQSLFGRAPDSLWSALASSSVVSFFLGEYRDGAPETKLRRWISTRDAAAQSELASVLGNPTRLGRDIAPETQTVYAPFDIAVWNSEDAEQAPQFLDDKERSGRRYEQFKRGWDDISAAFVGSQKTNYLTEYFAADLCRIAPFRRPKRGRVPPIYVFYREDDRHVPSCFGGTLGPPGTKRREPGIWYRSGRRWITIPSIHAQSDAAVVIAVRREQSLHFAAFGFAGRSTLSVARLLSASPELFQPLALRRPTAFVCPLRFQGQSDDHGTLDGDVIALPFEAG